MSILTGPAITAAMERGDLIVDPMPPWAPGPNSLDLRLGHRLTRYAGALGGYERIDALDPQALPPLIEVQPRADGRWLLRPGTLYLGQTMEHTTVRRHVPYLDGRSSAGRLGVSVHITAGRGDLGFAGVWTLELTVVHPVVLRPGMRICQLTLHEATGTQQAYAGQYQDADGIQPSGMGEGR